MSSTETDTDDVSNEPRVTRRHVLTAVVGLCSVFAISACGGGSQELEVAGDGVRIRNG